MGAKHKVVPIQLINEKQVLEKCGGVSRFTLHKWRRHHAFPRPMHIAGGGRNFWVDGEVDVWLDNNMERSITASA